MIRELKNREYKDLILNYHYAKRMPSVSFAYGYFENNELIGVVTFGKPASNSLCKGICGEQYASKVYELNRVVFKKRIKNKPSELVAYALRKLKQHNLIIVSYSDMAMNHHGYIYQATNWMYTGLTKGRTDKYVPKGKHSRHYNDDNNSHLRVVRSEKHRYVYFATNKTLKKELMRALNSDIIEKYPKGDNETYVLGSEQSRIILNKHTGEYYKD